MTHAEAFLSSRRGATPSLPRQLQTSRSRSRSFAIPARRTSTGPVETHRGQLQSSMHLGFWKSLFGNQCPISQSVSYFTVPSRPRAHPSTMPQSPPPSKQALQKDRVHYMCCKRAAGGADPITDAYRNHAFAPGATFELDPAHRAPVHHATHAVLALRLYVSLPIASRSTFRTCPAPRRASPP